MQTQGTVVRHRIMWPPPKLKLPGNSQKLNLRGKKQNEAALSRRPDIIIPLPTHPAPMLLEPVSNARATGACVKATCNSTCGAPHSNQYLRAQQMMRDKLLGPKARIPRTYTVITPPNARAWQRREL